MDSGKTTKNTWGYKQTKITSGMMGLTIINDKG